MLPCFGLGVQSLKVSQVRVDAPSGASRRLADDSRNRGEVASEASDTNRKIQWIASEALFRPLCIGA
jgi:hypothetical protein